MQRTLRTNIYCATENGYEDCHHRQQEATRVRQLRAKHMATESLFIFQLGTLL